MEVHEGVDLLQEGSYDRAMKDCDVVIHTAAPFPAEIRNEQHAEEVVAACVDGTRNILQAAARCGVQRVVVTASMAAIRGPADEPSDGRCFGVKDWNRTSRRDGKGMEPYQWAKTRAEEAAFELGDALGVQVVSILPTWVIGPPRHAGVRSASVKLVRGWLQGQGKVQSRLVCDVRDAAAAHVIAATVPLPPSSSRRILVGGEARVTAAEMRALLLAALAALPDSETRYSCDTLSPADTWVPPAAPAGAKEVEVAASLALLGQRGEEGGLELRPVSATVTDMVRALAAQPQPAQP